MTTRTSDKLTQEQKTTLLHLLEDYLMQEALPTPDVPMNIRRTFATITKRIRGDTTAVQVETDEYTFQRFWNAYQKKVGLKSKLQAKWNRLPRSEREYIINDYLPRYIAATPDKQFRKNPETFLNNKSWNDEIINNNGNSRQQQTANANQQFLADAAELVASIQRDSDTR